MEFPFDEEWRDIVGYEGIYKVSNFGRVKNIKTHKYLKVGNVRGIQCVTLCKQINNRKKLITGNRVDLIEMIAFNGIPYSKNAIYITHKDNNNKNNKIDNLKFDSLNKGKALPAGAKSLINVYYVINGNKYLIMCNSTTAISEKLHVRSNTLKKYIDSNIPIKIKSTNKEYILESL